MRRHRLTAGSMLALLSILFAILLVALVAPVSFVQNPSINNNTRPIYTIDNLVCDWDISADTTAINVTWYVNDEIYSSLYDDATLNTTSTITASATTKHDGWRCDVTLFNGTANSSAETNITVDNSAPAAPILYDEGGQPLGIIVNITEGDTTSYDLNSSDPDGDTLTYYLKVATFCTVSNGATGAVQCTPTHQYVAVGGGNETERPTMVNITFWVDDDDVQQPGSKGQVIAFNITPVNAPPVLVIPNQTTNVTAVFNSTFAATDEEHDYPLNASLVYTLTDVEIRDDVSVSVDGNATVRIVYYTSPFDYNDVGNRTVTLNLTDGGNASATVSFTLQVVAVNRAPYFKSFVPANWSSTADKTYVLAQGEALSVNITANDLDTNTTNQTITFSDNTSVFNIQTINATATNSSDAWGQINITPTNADVGNHTVLITITNNGATNTTTLNFTILNVNDPPVIYNDSYYATNTGGNANIVHLVAYLSAPFRYQINYTDPDIIWGDVLLFTDNTTLFDVTAGGLIDFTPAGAVRNETINITLVDAAGLNDSRSILLEILNNTPPVFNATFPQLLCHEKQPCILNVSGYAEENDADDNISNYGSSFIGADLSSFTINQTSGLINFTPIQTDIGDYTVNITIEDMHGASAWQLLNITVANTNDSPSWVRYNFSDQIIVEGHQFTYELRASDEDFLMDGSTEDLAFSTNLSWVTISSASLDNDTVIAQLSFTPNSGQTGVHTIQMNVTDSSNLTNSTTILFTVLADTEPPNITWIRPYGGVANAIVQQWLSVTGATVLEENVSLPENTSSVIFEANATDDSTPQSNLTYEWRYDGAMVSTSESYTRSFDFYSNGSHTLSVTVNDTTLESTMWMWTLAVSNVNRAPVLENNLTSNISIDSTTTLTDYFLRTDTLNRFFDSDDDTESPHNGIIDGSETSSLTYSSTVCSVANISAVGHSLRLVPISQGSCTVTFTASDPDGLTVSSNYVLITVTEVPQGAQSTTVSSGGGGGGTQTRDTMIPIDQEVETPKPLTIIAPKLVTIYENGTVTVPIALRNNWTAPLKMIVLGASTNATDVRMAFDTNFIEELPVNGTKDVLLTVYGYRLGQSFEVDVTANVTTPSFHDTALILFNSIEQSGKGEDVSVKVTFAQDLLSEHDECQELNELLSQANTQLQQGNIEGAGALVDTVINGCKYLISKTQSQTQRPGIIRTPLFEMKDETLRLLSYLALGIFIIIAAAALLYYHYKTRVEYDF